MFLESFGDKKEYQHEATSLQSIIHTVHHLLRPLIQIKCFKSTNHTVNAFKCLFLFLVGSTVLSKGPNKVLSHIQEGKLQSYQTNSSLPRPLYFPQLTNDRSLWLLRSDCRILSQVRQQFSWPPTGTMHSKSNLATWPLARCCPWKL